MRPRVHLINPSHVSFGVAVITPRWLYVLAAATGTEWGDPHLVDETLESLDESTIAAGDVVGIGIHTGNARRGYEIGRLARERGAWVVYGGIHATLYPDESREHGAAHAVVKGDGDLVWKSVVRDCFAGAPLPLYDGGRVERRAVRAGALGSAAARQLHVGVGADRARLPEALFVLLGVADRRTGATAARRRSGGAGDRRAAPPRLPLHRARRRQFLSGGDGRSRRGAPPLRSDPAARARGAQAGAIRADGRARTAAGRHGVLHPDHHGSGRGSRRFSRP